MIEVGRKTDAGDFFGGAVGAGIPTVAEGKMCIRDRGIGSSLSSHDVLTLLPWLDMPLLQAIFIWMSKVGSFAFSFLPVMFCIAIPLGLALSLIHIWI